MFFSRTQNSASGESRTSDPFDPMSNTEVLKRMGVDVEKTQRMLIIYNSNFFVTQSARFQMLTGYVLILKDFENALPRLNPLFYKP